MSDWIPVALSTSAEPGCVLATSVRGHEIAIWRTSDATTHVWRDRCPHRGMRLSLGFVRDDQLGCPYHGWRFDATGRCAFVPAHPDLVMPATVTVQALPSRESSSLIWVDLDGGQDSAGDGPPVVAGTFAGVRSVLVPAPVDTVRARLNSLALPSWPERAQADWRGALAGYRDDTVLIGVQPLDETRTAVHLCAPTSATVGSRTELAQLGARLRDHDLALTGAPG